MGRAAWVPVRLFSGLTDFQIAKERGPLFCCGKIRMGRLVAHTG